MRLLEESKGSTIFYDDKDFLIDNHTVTKSKGQNNFSGLDLYLVSCILLNYLSSLARPYDSKLESRETW